MLCPKGERISGFQHIVCRERRNGAVLKDEHDAIKAICGHQYYCPKTRQWENTPEMKMCPLRARKEGKNNG